MATGAEVQSCAGESGAHAGIQGNVNETLNRIFTNIETSATGS